MKRKFSNRTVAVIFFVAAIIYFTLFFKDKSYTMLTFGFVFTTLGFTYFAKDKKEQ